MKFCYIHYNKTLMKVLSSFIPFCITPWMISAAAAYDLNDAVQSAMRNNESIKSAAASLEIAKLQSKRAFTDFLPNVVASANSQSNYPRFANQNAGNPFLPQSSTENFLPEKQSSVDLRRITITQNLFAGGSSIAKLQGSIAQGKASEFGYQDALDKLILNTVEAYQKVILSRKIYEASLQLESLMNRSFEEAKTKYEIGAITRTDLSKAKAGLADALSRKSSAFGAMKNMEVAFWYVTGELPPDELDQVGTAAILLPNNFEELVTACSTHNKSIISSQYLLEVAKHMLRAYQTAVLPKIDVSASLSQSDQKIVSNASTDGQTYMLSVTVPIFSRGLEYVEIKDARLKMRRGEFDLNDTKSRIWQEATKFWNSYNQEAVSVRAESEKVHYNEQYVAGATEEFRVGTKTLVELLKAQTDLFDAKTSLINSESRLISAIFGLRYVIGNLSSLDFSKLNEPHN